MRMDRSKLNIGAYCLAPYAWSEKHVREIAQCGIDLMLCVPYDRALLDRFHENGVGAVVSSVVPGWFGGLGENAGGMARSNPVENYRADGFEDHPAVWGIDIGDEPSALDFPHYGKVFNRVREIFPNQFPYLNLYPGYAMVPWNTPDEVVAQLGVKNYAEYIEAYCRSVDSDYVCFDFYPYAANVPMFWENLGIVADACRKTGRSLWIVLQVNSLHPEVFTSTNRLRLQAYSALAFGAENIFWACYTAGWWNNQVLDENGEKTEQYDKLKQVNSELKALGEVYMKYRCTETQIVESEPMNASGFMGVCAEDGKRLIVGAMESKLDHSSALMICAASDPMDEAPETVVVRFRAENAPVRALSGSGEIELQRDAEGMYSLKIPACSGVLLVSGGE